MLGSWLTTSQLDSPPQVGSCHLRHWLENSACSLGEVRVWKSWLVNINIFGVFDLSGFGCREKVAEYFFWKVFLRWKAVDWLLFGRSEAGNFEEIWIWMSKLIAPIAVFTVSVCWRTKKIDEFAFEKCFWSRQLSIKLLL